MFEIGFSKEFVSGFLYLWELFIGEDVCEIRDGDRDVFVYS